VDVQFCLGPDPRSDEYLKNDAIVSNTGRLDNDLASGACRQPSDADLLEASAAAALQEFCTVYGYPGLLRCTGACQCCIDAVRCLSDHLSVRPSHPCYQELLFSTLHGSLEAEGLLT